MKASVLRYANLGLFSVLAACSGSADLPTVANAQLGFAATAAIVSSSRQSGLIEAHLLLDGNRVDSRTFQPAETGIVFLQVSDVFITSGPHRLSLNVVRQSTNPTTWDVQLGAVVLNLKTLATQEFKLRNDVQTVTLSNGQSVTLDFSVTP